MAAPGAAPAARWARLHAACGRIRALEAATGEDESKLEDLYRSEQWYAINYALAAVRYWQAWIDLALAETAADDAARVPALSGAERGFQSTAVRILYPGLVYGSWLGMAYVDRLRGDDAAAEKRLKLLAGALASDPGNPLAQLVADELALLRCARRPLKPIPQGASCRPPRAPAEKPSRCWSGAPQAPRRLAASACATLVDADTSTMPARACSLARQAGEPISAPSACC
jgi:hypothetical protein